MIDANDPGLPKTPEEKRASEDWIIKFRNTFLANRDTRDVWLFLHKTLGTFENVPDPTPLEAARQAFGMELLENAGINYDINLDDVLEKLWKVRPSYETAKILEKEREVHDD